jgi:hypothetical protein
VDDFGFCDYNNMRLVFSEEGVELLGFICQSGLRSML